MSKSVSIGPRIIILVAVIAIGAIVALLVFRDQSDNKATDKPTPPATNSGPLSVVLTTTNSRAAVGQTLAFEAVIRNTSDTPRTYNFTNTCTQGTLSIDGQATQRSQLCGEALTEVTINPGETKSYQYTFRLVKSFSAPVSGQPLDYDGEIILAPGRHSASLDWQAVKSNSLEFEVLP